MKRKAIKVEYRKTSESFPEWLKYEITILKEDGTTEKVPAYGKDLQDALSRVVHDERVEKISKKTSKIPFAVWVSLWFGYVTGLYFYSTTLPKHWTGITFIVGLIGITFLVGYFSSYWFKFRNVDNVKKTS